VRLGVGDWTANATSPRACGQDNAAVQRDGRVGGRTEDRPNISAIVNVASCDGPDNQSDTRERAQGPTKAPASGAGYVVHRALREWGYAREVIAPSLIPIKPGSGRTPASWKRTSSEEIRSFILSRNESKGCG
jgi:hypothetical protein